MPFQKGRAKTGGRKKGVPNKIRPHQKLLATLTEESVKHVHDLAHAIITDPAYLENLIQRLMRGEASPTIETMLWYYAFGKPPETITLKGDAENPLTVRLAQAHERIRNARNAA